MDVKAYAAKAAAANPMPRAPAPTPGLVAHVDGDFCAYNCAGKDETDPGVARRILLSKLDSIKYATGAESVIVHLTDPASAKGERYLAATVKPYQGQRNSGRKPRNWGYLREFMETYEGDRFRVKNWLTREADDGIAYVAHNAARNGKLAAIATKDKDMRMLPGRHMIWETKQLVDVPFGTFELVGPDKKVYGHKWFWLQMLMGDTADNIPGLPKYVNDNHKLAQMGEATASRKLEDVRSNESAFGVVGRLYSDYYEEEWADRFVEQAALLWLRTDRYSGLLDFMQVVPENRRVGEVGLAGSRLVERVTKARAALGELQCGD